ncbi:hypothetical protein [Nocardioides plantarum]|uniref:DUF1795 domain-containing protein n=1 Tax=Nocardioides plantarum TaxID=29299 RepID=A0ABV5K9T5_9ACTN|nr:hypothetical protein [Nocardioides plantarum]
MSDQSPWGAPPPSSPYGTPAQPPQPPYQPGGTGGWNGGPPSYGVPLQHGPQGPQGPKKKRTGLIVAVVAVVLLVAAAFTVTLVVVGNDDGDKAPDEASSSDASSQPTSDPTASDPTATDSSDPTDPTSDPTTGTSAPPVGDGDISGDGYSYDLPATGWKDASSDAKKLADTIDSAIVLGSSINLAQSSIIVEALSAGGAESLEDLEPLWKRNLSSTDNATPVDIADTTIDGERAIGVKIEDRLNNAGDPITQIAYLALHNGNQYSIGLSYPKTGDTTSVDDFKKMLASWRWSS